MSEIEEKDSRYSTPDKIELRSEEIQEILGRPPRWIICYGISVILIAILIIFVGSYFFKYPDVINSTIVVTTENLPANVIAKASGRIDTMFVEEKQQVNKGDFIALIESTAKPDDVLKVKAIINNYNVLEPTQIPELGISSLQLGEIQSAYIAFTKAHEDYMQFIKADYYNKKIAITEKQINAQKGVLQKTQNQLKYSREQLASAKQLFSMDSTLFAQKTLSKADYETAKSRYSQEQQSHDNALLAIENQKISILQSEQTIFDLKKQNTDQINQLQLTLSGAYDILQTQIKNWEQAYLLISPCDGIITMTNYTQKNQNIPAGETLATVVPKADKKIIGKILLPPQGAGKVKEGQTVNVKFDNFPYMEYGIVQVKIKNISLVPVVVEKNRAYMLEVEFPERLKTSYGKELTFSQEMQGSAEIITEDLRLIDKFLNPIRDILKNKVANEKK